MKLLLATIAVAVLTSAVSYAVVDFNNPSAAIIEEGQKAKPSDGPAYYLTAITIGFALALAAMFGALGQSRAIAASVESIARQPEAGGRIFISMIIGLALIETLVIYTLVICFLLMGKLA